MRMKRKCPLKACLLIALLSCLSLQSCRRSALLEIDTSFSFRIESKSLSETREIFIHLPDGYDKSESKFPVLYVLDAEDVFGYAVGAVDFLSRSRIPEMIVVGIPNTNRERDIWVDLEDPNGGYVRFIQFLEKELIPTVDARFRTQPYRVLYGFCSGASTSFWLLFSKPEMFDGYIASGTGFDETWAELARQAFESRPFLKKSLFAVTEGTTPRALGMPLLRDLLKTSAPSGLRWDAVVMEGEEHGPVLAKGLFAGLRFIFREWQLPRDVAAAGPDSVKKYYESLSHSYGYDFQPPMMPVLSAAFSLLYFENKGNEAVELYRWMTDEYPNSPDAWEALGVAYEMIGQLKQSKESFEFAVLRAGERSDRRLPTYVEELESVTRRLR